MRLVRLGLFSSTIVLAESLRPGRSPHCESPRWARFLLACYADIMLPSSPCETQTRKINSLHWATDDAHCSKPHNTEIDVGAAPKPPNSLLRLQGPLL